MSRRSSSFVWLFASLAACSLLLGHSRAAQQPLPPAKDATQYPAVDVHPAEHVAIAAEPYNTETKESFFKFNYVKYGVMPIRIIVTNSGDQPISLADARINFITAAGDKIPAAEPEDVERLTNRVVRPDSGYKLPGPLPRIGKKSSSSNKAIEADFHTYEYAALAVEPHTTRAGFLFYDLNGVANPLIGGHLNLSTLRDAKGKELFYFDIPFDKYLAAPASGPAAAH